MKHLIAIALITAATPAAAQDRPARSVDDYACALTAGCTRPSAARAVSAESTPADADSAAQDPAQPTTARFSLAPPRADLSLAFERGSARLTPAARREARTLATALKRPSLAATRFRIEGHTDASGTRAGNVTLSRQRADAVKAELVRLGVSARRLEARGYGPDRPLSGLPAGSPRNRRVEAVALP